uniref:Uncharacterized protein n=1 Tax=Spermophilus dauricus TaxID=99837 RepID=A0A8C9P7R1_SPEDA
MHTTEKTTQSIEGRKQYYWVPERERKQIQRHIHRTGQAREFKSKTFRQPRPLSATILPKIKPEKHSIPTAQRRKQVNEREQMQIKDHQERMIRGRELIEQKLKERILRKSQSQLPTYEKQERIQKEILPRNRSRIKVNILMEKHQNTEEVDTSIKPHQRRFLVVPPFLKSQIRKIKD